MPLRLPPLASLRFFEAAGRHQSFKRAAEELGVTPSAISHGIVALERWIGAELFVREARGLRLTPAGTEYLPYISEALSLIAIGTQRLNVAAAIRTIVLSCAPTIASRWLLPRLEGFRRQWPNVTVTVDTSHRLVEFPVDGVDFAIRLSRVPTAGSAWTRLFGEQLVPVCAPAYRRRRADIDGALDLRKATLIHVSSISEDWTTWLDATGMSGVDTAQGLRFDTIQLALEAATAGLGVAMGRKPLVLPDLARGALVEAASETISVESAYWLVSSARVERRPDLLAFKRWLVGEAANMKELSETRGLDASGPPG